MEFRKKFRVPPGANSNLSISTRPTKVSTKAIKVLRLRLCATSKVLLDCSTSFMPKASGVRSSLSCKVSMRREKGLEQKSNHHRLTPLAGEAKIKPTPRAPRRDRT
jgi:hypothetical protein